jgi:hypothetical protein
MASLLFSISRRRISSGFTCWRWIASDSASARFHLDARQVAFRLQFQLFGRSLGFDRFVERLRKIEVHDRERRTGEPAR